MLAGLVRPVKGEIVRLAHRAGALPPPARTVRALVDGRPVYAVPRDDGGLVVGATQYEAGFDTDVTVGGVRDLLRDVERVLPAVAEYTLVETAAGLRPGSPDNLPLIGALGPDGLLVATGHGRNGMLLAPVTADAVVALLRGASRCRAAAPGRSPRTRYSAPSRGAWPTADFHAPSETGHVQVWINGSRASWPTDAERADALTLLGAPSTGVAVAVDGAVVPAGRGPTPCSPTGARVEVLTAVQGG